VTVAESAPQADTRSLSVIRTTVGQHFSWQNVARVSRPFVYHCTWTKIM